jgi:phosphoglycolate phosphatase
MLYQTVCDTPVGRLTVVCTEQAIHSLERMDEPAYPVMDTPLARLAQRQLAEYFAGERRAFDLPLDPAQGTAFQKRVWQAVQQIPYGQTRSYREVAQMLGKPRAARPVGGAMAQTPFPIIVPCHRVVSASGGLGGYGGRSDEKAFLLALEKRSRCRQEGQTHILFDLDGTLTDPKEGITKSVQYALADFGIMEPDLEALVCFIGPPLKESFQEYYGMDEPEAEHAVCKYRERFSEVGLYENRVFEGVKELLTELRAAGKTLAVATSKPTVFAKKILKKYELTAYFEEIVGSELDGRRSQKAEVIEEALHRLDMQDRRDQVTMVGDRRQDVQGAKACGVKSIGVRFGYAEPGELESAGADAIAADICELRHLLLTR